MPEFLQDRPMALAATVAIAWSYLIIRVTKLITDKFPTFKENILPKVQKTALFGIGVAPIAYATLFPEAASYAMSEHEVYTSGMIGGWAGSLTGIAHNIHKETIESKLT